MVRDGVEGLGNPDMVVGLVRAFSDHDVGSHAGDVGLIGDRDQIEKKFDLLVEIVLQRLPGAQESSYRRCRWTR